MLQRRNECHKHASSQCKEQTNSQSKETCGGKGHSRKIPPWVKVSGHRGRVLQGLRIRHASDGSIESNMEPTLGQRRKNENVINKTQ